MTTWLVTGGAGFIGGNFVLDAAAYMETIEKRQGLRVCCPEEITWRNGWIDDAALRGLAQPLGKSGYGEYLLGLLEIR